MAARLIALFNRPEDPAEFDRHYRDVHAPIVRRYPGLRELKLTRADGVGGRPSPIHLVAEMGFASRADLDAAMTSEPAAESARDLRNFASAGVTLLIADDDATFEA